MKDVLIGSLTSKTQWLALAVVILGVLQDQAGLITQIFGPEHGGKVISAIGLLFMVLRAVTTQSLADKRAGK